MADFRCLVVVFILSLLVHQGTTADVFVMFTGPDGNEIDFDVEQDPISGEWEVYLNHTRNGFGGTFHIRSTSNAADTIAFIRCNLDDPIGVTVSVEMNPNNDALVRTVRSIYSVNTAKIVVSQCVVTHDVESIEVDRIGSITAGGSIYGPITITEDNLDTLSAGSNIATDLSVTDGLIKNIEAGAAVGSLSTPVSITAHDYVRRVTGTSVHANINVTGNGSPYGAFGRLVTTSGDFTGSLTCERIVPID